MRASLFKSASDFPVLPNRMRGLSAVELDLVAGGDSCGPGGDPGGTLSEVTVNGGAPDPGGGNGISQADAENLAQHFGLANGSNPALAAFLFMLQIMKALQSMTPTPPIGNPMGDPSGGYAPAGGP